MADDGEPVLGAATDWVLVSRSRALCDGSAFKGGCEEIEVPQKLTVWTDDFNNLFQVLK